MDEVTEELEVGEDPGENDAIPRSVRRALYWVNVVFGGIILIITSLIGSGLVPSDTAVQDVMVKVAAFLTSLIAGASGAVALAYSKAPK